MTPDQSAARARELKAMLPGDERHRLFDQMVNLIARAHGHGEAVDIFEAEEAGRHK